jgi:hypothetical protein
MKGVDSKFLGDGMQNWEKDQQGREPIQNASRQNENKNRNN